MPKKGVGLTFMLSPEPSLRQVTSGKEEGAARTDLGLPSSGGGKPESEAGQGEPKTSFLVEPKTRPLTQSATKQAPTSKTLASTKRLTKIPIRGSNSKRPKR